VAQLSAEVVLDLCVVLCFAAEGAVVGIGVAAVAATAVVTVEGTEGAPLVCGRQAEDGKGEN
jgi:hypothetical protein